VRAADFDYDLPPGAIASRPVEPRDAARLLVVDRAGDALAHRLFRDLPDLLDPGDLLVVNDARVIPARLLGRREGTGGEVEVFLLRATGDRTWRALVRPARRLRPGVRVLFDGDVACEVVDVHEGGERTVRFDGAAPVLDLAERVGRTPLPPYLRREADARDRSDYQTVYARAPGAVAAPTAGLHVTEALLERLRTRGIGLAAVTLHVGAGTFRPVVVDDLDEHRMESEAFEVPPVVAAAAAAAWAAGRRVVALGTTVVRALESAATGRHAIAPREGVTDRFIRPPYEFRAVDALVTNFHLPRSTLLMLVAAFGGRERALRAYREAVEAGYRFYSYGDAMLIR
jgi:S-adenosylmethionine:tRNA ribosyltransferase-isomerase